LSGADGSGGGNPDAPLGVCLGHQAIGQAFGGNGALPRDRSWQDGDDAPRQGMFRGLPSPFRDALSFADRDRATLPDCLEVTAWPDDGTIMGLKHRSLPIEGVQLTPNPLPGTWAPDAADLSESAHVPLGLPHER
jgi:anthranilate synthase component 2